MYNKNNIVSIVLLSISCLLFILFTFTIFFVDIKISGAIYFIFCVMLVAFAFLDRKYHSNFFSAYRYSAYLADLLNIFAVAYLLYFKIYFSYMIACLSICSVAFIVDLFAKNRLEKRRIESILLSLCNCVFMFTICPFFFTGLNNVNIVPAIAAVVMASIVLILKLVLAIFKSTKHKNYEENNTKTELEVRLEQTLSSRDSDNDVE